MAASFHSFLRDISSVPHANKDGMEALQGCGVVVIDLEQNSAQTGSSPAAFQFCSGCVARSFTFRLPDLGIAPSRQKVASMYRWSLRHSLDDVYTFSRVGDVRGNVP